MSGFAVKFMNGLIHVLFYVITFFTFLAIGMAPASFEWMAFVAGLIAYTGWGILAGFWYMLCKIAEQKEPKTMLKGVDITVQPTA